MEKDLLQLWASMLHHQSTALRAVSPRTAAGCAARAGAGCLGLSCRAGPCCASRAVCQARRSLQNRAEHTVAVMCSVSSRDGMWGQRSGCRQLQLQAAEIWAGRERRVLTEKAGRGNGHLTAIPAVHIPSLQQPLGLFSLLACASIPSAMRT